MIHKPFIIVLVLFVFILGTLLMCNCHRRSRHCFFHASPEKRANWIASKISKELKLNEEQKVKLNEIKTEFLAKKQEFKGSREEIFNAFTTQVKNDSFDQDALNQLFEAKELEMKEMRFFFISKLAEFHDVLEPEQRVKLAEKMNKFHKKMHH